MDLDVASADRSIETVIVNSNFAAVLVPDLDAESVVIWVQILGPDHEHVGFIIWRQYTIDGARSLELGISAALVDH